MAYRNGTYVAFHAEGTNVPTDSDIKYYNLLKMWTAKKDDDFSMRIDSLKMLPKPKSLPH